MVHTGHGGALDAPLFLLGVGAQKAGTSWLYEFLTQSPSCVRGIAKEATVFDAIDVPEHTVNRRRILDRAAEELARLERAEPADAHFLQRAAMIADPRIYFDHYAALVRDARGPRFTMDFTPNYGLLPVRRMVQIREEFAARGVGVKVVFLMRDPVDRVWSNVRMHLRQREHHGRGPARGKSDVDLLLERYRRPTVEVRPRYEDVLGKLDDAFAADEVHHQFYERLFTGASVRSICDFIGIDTPAADFEAQVNASPRETRLPETVVATLATHYRATYLAVAERFGRDVVSSLWPSSRFVL